MSMSDVKLLLSKTIDTKKLYSNNVSAETRAKLSAANKGRVLVRDSSLISKALKGVPKSEAHRKKLSEAALGRKAPPELIAYNKRRTQNASRYKGKTNKEWAELLSSTTSNIRDHLKRHGHLDYVGRTSGWAKI
jgi:hypothetical protein